MGGDVGADAAVTILMGAEDEEPDTESVIVYVPKQAVNPAVVLAPTVIV